MTDEVSEREPLHLFEGFGVEIEYMVVADETLDVRPIVDDLLRRVAGADEFVSDVEFGPIAWSNELVLHVLELKTNGPAASLDGLADRFHENVVRANAALAEFGARLLPTGMHPWMDPHAEMRLWPHDYGPVYEAFHRVFDCRGHGWANLQSVHLNLPFANDEEFARLHAAIRIVLPLLPGLAASSPFVDGHLSSSLDTRLDVYRTNARTVPEVSGRVIPEPAFDRASYERMIFEPLYAAIAPHDPAGVLQDEFLNARGAIARFDRNAIEIRLLDTQECPARDLAVAATVVAVLRQLVNETWSTTAEQQAVSIDALEPVLLGTICDADEFVVEDPAVLAPLGVRVGRITVGELWRRLVHECTERDVAFARTWSDEVDALLNDGPLARRLVASAGVSPTKADLRRVYGNLAACLAENQPYQHDAQAST